MRNLNLQIFHNFFERSGITYMHILNLSEMRLTNSIRSKRFPYKNANEKLVIFNKIILNKLSNIISHETIIISDRDHHGLIAKYIPWHFRHNRNNVCVRRQSKFHLERLIDLIKTCKQKYYWRVTKQSVDTQKSSKA